MSQHVGRSCLAAALLTTAALLSCGRDQPPASREQEPRPAASATAPAATPPSGQGTTPRSAQVSAPGAAARGPMPAFDRSDFLAAMNRLHQYYMAPEGLRRPDGLSINGAPDFVGIAAWIFDVYLTCRAGGRGTEDAWGEVVAWISQSDEWKARHPGEAPRTPSGCASPLPLDRAEFLDALQRLDVFYRATDGLQRPNGLSIGGAPDFVGIAAWVFDIYLNARLAGRAKEAAWGEVVGNIQGSEEWKAKHAQGGPLLRFAVIGDYGTAGDAERDVAALVKSWRVDMVITTGDNNYPDGAASTIDANIGQYYSDFIFPYPGRFGSTASRNRFFPSLGNHDWETPGAVPYLNYFTLPGNERYYDFTEGPVHFFALDSDPREPDGTGESSVQAQWLHARLSGSTLPYRFVYMHHAPFSSGSNGSTVAMQWPYRNWGASAVLAGHDHTYERVMHDNIPYFVNGTGGYSLYSFPVAVPGSAIRYNGDHGALLVEIDRNGAVFTFVTRGGAVVDSYRLTP